MSSHVLTVLVPSRVYSWTALIAALSAELTPADLGLVLVGSSDGHIAMPIAMSATHTKAKMTNQCLFIHSLVIFTFVS